MKTMKVAVVIAGLLAGATTARAQKNMAEGTITYDMEIQSVNGAVVKTEAVNNASTTVYLKGNSSRTEMVSALGNETTIHNAKTGAAVILKEFSGQKLMIKLTKENWDTKNKGYKDISFDISNETIQVAGYTCKKAVAKLADGKTFVVYYSPDIQVTNKDYDPTFTNLPGLPVQYEIESGKMKFRYTLSKISNDPVAAAKFDFPTSGYRVMTYEENQQLKKGN